MISMREKAGFCRLDGQAEGGLFNDLDRAVMADKPTLVIGLGGVGAQALLYAKRTLQRKLEAPAQRRHPGRLAFLAIDSDAAALKRLRAGDVFLEASEVCCIREADTAAILRARGSLHHAWQRDWLSPDLETGAFDQGAAGVRQLGRFQLIRQAEQVIRCLQARLTEVWDAGREDSAPFDEQGDALNVYIISGLCGGTGSGALLDVAYLARYVADSLCRHRLDLRGLLFLPELEIARVGMPAAETALAANGWAALKELDFWMNPGRGRRFGQRYAPNVSVDADEAPFDLCFLLAPQSRTREAAEACLHMPGRALLALLTAPSDGAAGDGDFDAFAADPATLGRVVRRYAANYGFASLGVAQTQNYSDQAANCIGWELLRRVQDMDGRAPGEAEAEEIFRQLELDCRQGLPRRFEEGLADGPFDRAVRSPADLKAALAGADPAELLQGVRLDGMLREWVEAARVHFDAQRPRVRAQVNAAAAQAVDEAFADPQRGPFYALRLLSRGTHNLLRMVREEQRRLSEALSHAEADAPILAQRCEEKRVRALKMHLTRRKRRALAEYLEAAYAAAEARRFAAIGPALMDVYGALADALSERSETALKPGVELLQALAEVFSENQNANWPGAAAGGQARVQRRIEERFRALEGSGAIEGELRAFLQLALEAREQWLGEYGDLSGSLSAYIARRYGDVMRQPLQDAFQEARGLSGEDAVRDFLSGVMPRLEGAAAPLFNADATLSPLSNGQTYDLVLCPGDSASLRAAADGYLDGKALRGQSRACGRSAAMTWLKAVLGLPLYAIADAGKLQRAYDRAGAGDGHAGRHLKEGLGEDWRTLLPSPLPEGIWLHAGCRSEAAAARNAAMRAQVKAACSAGRGSVVQTSGAGLRLGEVDADALEALLAAAPLSEVEAARVRREGAAEAALLEADAGAAAAFAQQADTFAETAWKAGDAELDATPFLLLAEGVPVADEKTAPERRECQLLAENLLRAPDIVDRLNAQMAQRERLAADAAAHRSFAALRATGRERLERFARALAYGVCVETAPGEYALDAANSGIAPFAPMAVADAADVPAADGCYALFRRFAALDDARQADVERLLALREDELNEAAGRGDAAPFVALAAAAQRQDAQAAARAAELSAAEACDRPELLHFYSALRTEFAYWLGE